MPRPILITGAGVDKSPGINFPLAADLLPSINNYIKNTDEGRAVEALIRSHIPGLTFRFDKFINSAITEITQREPDQLQRTITRVNQAVQALPDTDENRLIRRQGELIVKLFDQLRSIAENNILDDETRALIEEIFGDRANEINLDDQIVDIRTLSISETFKNVLRFTLRQSLDGGVNPVAHALGADMLDVELLLIGKFLGFYNNRLSDIKSYVYIAWCLWAFLVNKNREAVAANTEMSFYSRIPQNWHAITLNYTSFLEDALTCNNTCYFHGGLQKYVRMDNRQLLRFDGFSEHSPQELLETHICRNWSFDQDNPVNSVCLIPSLVPPLRLKPILSKEYIDIWHEASNWIQNASRVIIVGYSLNTADEHFNDLIRANAGKPTTIIGPDVLTHNYMDRVTRVYGSALTQFTPTRIQNFDAKQTRDLTLINARAHEIDLSALR